MNLSRRLTITLLTTSIRLKIKGYYTQHKDLTRPLNLKKDSRKEE